MKIVLVTEFYYPHLGGVTEHVHHLAAYLGRAGHRVLVVTSHVSDAPRQPELQEVGGPRGYQVARIGRGLPIESNGSQSRVTVGFGLERRMRALLGDADLVHVHSPLFPMLPYLALKTARRLGLPTVGTFHTNFGGSTALKAFGPVVRQYARAIDFPIAVSESAARVVAPYLQAPCAVIPNGVDVQAWSAGQPRSELSDGMRNVVFLGRLDPRNDLEVLLRAFATMAEARRDLRLVLVGDGPRRAAHQEALSAALRGRVIFAGSQPEVAARAAFLASADVMAFTARIVSHPMALIEGMAAGRPAVAYDIEGVRELIVDGREGYKVPVGDESALGRALLTVLEDDAHRRVMGRLARARAQAYDWSTVAARIEAVYRSAVGAHPVVAAAPARLLEATA